MIWYHKTQWERRSDVNLCGLLILLLVVWGQSCCPSFSYFVVLVVVVIVVIVCLFFLFCIVRLLEKFLCIFGYSAFVFLRQTQIILKGIIIAHVRSCLKLNAIFIMWNPLNEPIGTERCPNTLLVLCTNVNECLVFGECHAPKNNLTIWWPTVRNRIHHLPFS